MHILYGFLRVRSTAALCALTVALTQAACGGGSSADSADAASTPSVRTATRTDEGALVAQGAALNTAELAEAGQETDRGAHASGEVARKAAAVRIPVYRFYNQRTGAHFFTTSSSERDHVVATQSPPFVSEGEAFSVASDFSPGLSPVHRFFNTRSGVHFYTISENERALLVSARPELRYEGIAYYASQVAGEGLQPFYRFYVPAKGFHFYTASEAERASLVAQQSAGYRFEGVAYYVLDPNWRAQKLPHTGITDQQCYEAGSQALVPCARATTKALNPQQDGHRTTVNPMSYSMVRAPSRGLLLLYYPSTSCLRDNVTGLIWEGKTDDAGLRDKDNTYTHLGNGLAGDASAYVAAVNASQLCGFSDWRLPSAQELQGLVDYSRTSAPLVNPTWFANASADLHWAAEPFAPDASFAWAVQWGLTGGNVVRIDRAQRHAVRLVRGAVPGGTRFTTSTVAYGADAANNVVNDGWTGLQWRRCEQGRTWNGSTCTGTASSYLQEAALDHARQQSGWRMPNAKELASLVMRGQKTPLLLDPTAFAGAQAGAVWSSTPMLPLWSTQPSIGGPRFAFLVSFATGDVQANVDRSYGSFAVRLVREQP